MHTHDYEYDAQDFLAMFRTTLQIVSRHRPWFHREYLKSPIHRAVELAIMQQRPADWHQLLLEYPHIAEADPTRLAYTRDERAGEADRQTTTTVGKYLTRHFPMLADHIIRDIVARTTTQSQMFFVDNMTLMLHHLMDGPGSCMNNGWSDDYMSEHPYNAYEPELGWRMAVRVKDGLTCGRALVYREANGEAYFVRSYKRTDGYSYSDQELEAWLFGQNITKRGDWGGAFLAKLPPNNTHCEFLAPYLDGDIKCVNIWSNTQLIVMEDGEYECSNTDGTHDAAVREECSHCGDPFRNTGTDGYWTGPYGDAWVCNRCVNNEYVEVHGRYGDEYFLHTDEAITDIDGNAYDANFLDDNDIVELYNGDYAHIDQAWSCADSGDWYLHDDVEPVEIDGDNYHPDSSTARRKAEQTTDEE